MSEARRVIFERLRQSTRRMASLEDSQAEVKARITAARRGPIPAPVEDRISTFLDRASATSATVDRIPTIHDAGDAIARYCMEHGLDDRIVLAPSPRLAAIHWPPDFSIDTRTARGDDLTSVSLAYAGIAETGTLALLSRPETPTLLNFLPDNHICLLLEADLAAQMEDVWQRMRDESQAMPRMLNFITGPSRTADVEQTIQLGAHGPRRLHILLVKAETAPS